MMIALLGILGYFLVTGLKLTALGLTIKWMTQ